MKVAFPVLVRVIAALFVALGLAVALFRDLSVGLLTVAFFGSCLAIELRLARSQSWPIRGRGPRDSWWEDPRIDFTVHSEARLLSRPDIVGARLLEIAQKHDWEVGGTDTACVLFIVDQGFAFALPVYDEPFRTSPFIPGAKLIRGPRSGPLLGSAIVDILREADTPEYYGDDLYLLLENGWALGVCSAAPHGTGAAGLHIFAPEQFQRERLVSIWA